MCSTIRAMSWDDYDVFCRVIEHGGFSAAARAMDLPKSTVSASISRLETALRARLLERTTRRVRLTEAGETLYDSVGALFTGLREARAEALARDEVVAGTLRIAAPYEFSAHHLGPVACSLMTRHAQLNIRIDVTHELIHPMERRHDIVFATLEGELPASTLIQRRMLSLERGVFASPELLAHRGAPSTPQELAELPLLCDPADVEWTFTAADGAIESVPTRAPRLSSDNANVRLQAAVAGLGVARITATYCEPAVRAGQLRRLLPGYTSAPLRACALLPGRRLMPAKVRLFLDALGQHAHAVA
jgi:DNA-binding transcriptional LysR family regulator